MNIITLLVVGLIAGLLASAVMRGSGYGVIGDVMVGVAGAFLGSWGFRELHWHMPFGGLAGVIAVAFLGALVLLMALRMLRSVGVGTRRTDR